MVSSRSSLPPRGVRSPGRWAGVLVLATTVLSASGLAQRSPHGTLSVACEQCHSAESWTVLLSPLKFAHASTGFPLQGQHAVVRCTGCHASLKFSGARNLCADCHDDVHRGELGKQCDRCHTSESWLVADMVQKHKNTRFALVGAHAAADCRSCHPNERNYAFTRVRTDCFACHTRDYAGTRNPDHRAAGFSTDCSQCHAVNSLRWGGDFNHAETAFPLTGAHRALPCSRCHAGSDFHSAKTDCYGCHGQVFASAANPKHTGFSTACLSCHTTTAWQPASFDHNTTAFKLSGAHIAVPCANCHKNGVFAGTTSTCYPCHQQQFTAAANPKHTGLSTDCKTCHTTTAWRPASFDHNLTAFKLTGAHAAVPCTQCHLNGVYTGTSAVCYTCHQQAFTTAANPKHTGFPTECATCHTTSAWRPASFDHNRTNFALTGAHVSTPCVSCHVGGVYTGTPSTCGSSGCHLPRYNATTNPPHAGAGFGTDCQTCHTTTAWTPSTFNHTPWFPISAGSKHPPGRWTVCADCHTVPSNYKAFSCIDCHEHSNKTRVDQQHAGRANYTYTSAGCYSCHPRGTN